MDSVSALIDAALKGGRIIGDKEYEIDECLVEEVRDTVKQLCNRFLMR